MKENNDNKEKEEKNEEDNEEEEKEEENDSLKERSIYSLEGAKKPISIYTRRVMDISKINKYLTNNSTRGQCGGHNLGNTCFMNSSIACLSNCTELTYYFLKGDYKKDINKNNNLGMKGELAESWGELLHQYWVENTKVGDPSDFKKTIGKKAVRFRGYNQHDSNEFMSIFLDYLNEDLNRTSKKEYIEMKEKQNNETDEECSKRFWDCNLKRNDSIITDLFCGQFKSTITCPECGYINITFDPFDTINLPMINKNKNKKGINLDEFQLYYVPKYSLRDPICLRIKNINDKEYFDNVIDRIKKEKNFIYHDKIDKLLLVDVYNKKVHEYINKGEKLNGYTCNNENVFSFDITNNKDLKIPIYFLDRDDIDSKSKYPRIVFGKNDMTLDDLRKKIYFNLRKYILSPFLKENEKKDSLSLEIEKYIKDEKLELNDEKLLELIEKEYQEVFNNNKKENENEKYIENFRKDIPFKIYIKKRSNQPNIIIVDNKYFITISPELKELTKLESFKDSLINIAEDIEDYKLYVEFNQNSKYINKDKFDLDNYNEYSMEYEIKKEKEKDEIDEDDGKLTLEKCLKKFCREEQLGQGDEWYCSKCKKHVLAKKKMELYYLPKILIIYFKRFIKESYRWEKNEDNVDFPINNMDLKNIMIGPDKEHSKYDLFAVSQHYGSTGFGHYTAVCKNDGKWYSYDDSSCEETNENDCLSSAAYVLFYRRQTD